jgi:hypothetical protein
MDDVELESFWDDVPEEFWETSKGEGIILASAYFLCIQTNLQAT